MDNKNAATIIYGDIQFRTTVKFTTAKQIYDTINTLVNSGAKRGTGPDCQLICYPKEIGNDYQDRHNIVMNSINGEERPRIWLAKNYGSLIGSATKRFYYTYINDRELFHKLKEYIEKKEQTAEWNMMLNISNED